jgi:quercetin dioxygenase-like cupin family protein
MLGAASAGLAMTATRLIGAGSAESAASASIVYSSRFSNVTAPAESFDLFQIVQDFSPGAYLGWHSHDFPVFVLVVAGQATLKRGNVDHVRHAGGGLQCGPGLHTMGNDVGNQTMRRIVTLLQPPGLPVAVPGTGPFTPSVSPTSVGTARQTVASPPAAFDFAQALIELAPGASTAPYALDGANVWMVVEGEISVNGSSYVVGEKFALNPGEASALAAGASKAQVALSVLQPAGLPLPAIAAAGGTITPPSTGDGGLLRR